jgi:hypothetical protein
MSDTSTIYDAIVTRMGTLFPNHKRIGNPYKPEENAEPILTMGWGLTVGEAVNTNRVLSNQFTVAREFALLVCRKAFHRESDAAARATTEKLILEDLYTLIKDFEINASLNGVAMNTKYLGDGGIEAVMPDKDQFLMIRARISVEYWENLNA